MALNRRWLSSWLVLLSFVSGFLAPTVQRANVIKRRAEEGLTSMKSPATLSYAADYRKPGDGKPLSEETFLAQFELEEREDKEMSRTLIELREGNYVYIGATDGVPFNAAAGRWLFLADKNIVILELVRNYENYNTIRLLIADVIALDKTPPLIEGSIKIPSQSAADLATTFHHDYELEDPTFLDRDSVGFFTAIKIPEPVPLD